MSQLAPIGDRGQRYEVIQFTETASMVWGWTNHSDGGSLFRACCLHPCSVRVECRDREDGGLANEWRLEWQKRKTSPPQRGAAAEQEFSMDQQKPSVGRIVHYHGDGILKTEGPGAVRAALITEVPVQQHDGPSPIVASLAIYTPVGVLFERNVPYDAEGRMGTWRWPPRV